MKNKILSLMLAVSLVMSLLAGFKPAVVSADTEDGWVYTIVNDYAQIESCTKNETDIVIPETLGGKKVAYIGKDAFSECTAVENITIPSGIKATEGLGYYRFSKCTNLKSINVVTDNDAYSSIDGVLYNKEQTSLLLYPIQKEGQEYVMPDSVVNISNWAFRLNDKLQNIKMSHNVKWIGNDAFFHCDSLNNIVVPDSVEYIGERAFSECGNLEKVIISKKLKTIENSVFDGCVKLKAISIPQGITNIGNFAFSGCLSLENITIPDSVTTMGVYVFYHCENLKIVTFRGNKPKNISRETFMNEHNSISRDIKILYPERYEYSWSEYNYYTKEAYTEAVGNGKELYIDSQTFPDAYIRTLLSWDADLNHDGALQKNEIEQLTELYITKGYDQENWANFKEEREWFARVDCKGLENFTNLKTLYIQTGEYCGVGGVYYNNSKYPDGCRRIYNIDSILHLKKLKKLTLEGDEKMKKLDVSGLKSLEELELTCMDNLRTIKLNNRKLKKYDQYGCDKLKAVDFSKLKALKRVYLDGVKLRNIKFGKKNKKLTLLDIRGKIKTLRKLDLSQLENLKSLGVQEVSNIKTINLENNKKIKYVSCSLNKRLRKVILPRRNHFGGIYLDRNNIKKFDTSRINNKKIQEIDLSCNPLKSVDITKLKKLKTIVVSGKTKVIKAKGQKTKVVRLRFSK